MEPSYFKIVVTGTYSFKLVFVCFNPGLLTVGGMRFIPECLLMMMMMVMMMNVMRGVYVPLLFYLLQGMATLTSPRCDLAWLGSGLLSVPAQDHHNNNKIPVLRNTDDNNIIDC